MAQPFQHQRSRQLQVIHRAPWYALNPGHLHLPSATDLPAAFPHVEAPLFHYGDRRHPPVSPPLALATPRPFR